MYVFIIPLEVKDKKALKKICKHYDCKATHVEGYYYEITAKNLEDIFWLGANLNSQLTIANNEKSKLIQNTQKN